MSESGDLTCARLAEQCRQKFFAVAPEIDVVITIDPVHVGYLSGYRSILQDMPPYQQALIATREGYRLITGASDAAAALEALELPETIYRYGTFYVGQRGQVPGYDQMPAAAPDFASALHSALVSLSLAGKRVGTDIADSAILELVRGALPSEPTTSVSSHLVQSRSTKLPGELDRLRKASRITDEAITHIGHLVHAGVSELDIAGEITRHMVRHGGVPRFVVVTAGDRSARVDAYATARLLNQGDLVRLDIGCTVDGYYSDMARTLTVGTPSDEQERRYQSLFAAEQAQLAALKPGAHVSEIYEIAMSTVRAGALPDYGRNHCGHGIGLRSHEYPFIAPNQTAVLEAGMVVSVETPYYELGWGGMMVEDTAIITQEGSELLTNSSRMLVPQLSVD